MEIWGTDIKLNTQIRNLVSKMENASDFNYDDEEVLLTKLLKKKGLRYSWTKSIFNPKIIIFKDTKENVMKLYKYHDIEITPSIMKQEGWKDDVWKVRE